jgi:hypothetical protein
MNTTSPHQRISVRIEPLPDGSALLHDLETDAIYAINATAAIVWELYMGGTPVDQIADQLALIFEASVADVRDDVATLLDQFAGLHLLQMDGR